jgi:hypothetical protein
MNRQNKIIGEKCGESIEEYWLVDDKSLVKSKKDGPLKNNKKKLLYDDESS